jgi:hypothetical protein
MTHAEADALAKRIINCWRGGPPLTEWIDELERLDAGTAGTTYARLKRTSEHAPSIAKFYAEYNALDTHDGGTRPADCRFCDGTGWLETRRHQAMGVAYSGCEPCSRCSEGRAREVSETWTKSPVRDFVTDAEAERLIAAGRERAR